MRTSHLAVVLLALGAAAGCASLQAKAPERPALNVPPPPPHVVELPAEPLEPVGEIPSPTSAPATRPARPTRETTPKPQPDKPESKPPDTPPVETAPAPPPVANPPAPAPQLRTPQTADPSVAAKNARNTIESARSMLGRVNFGPLSNERKKAYNDAKLSLQQAEDALKQGDLVFAQAMATKAETLARELASR